MKNTLMLICFVLSFGLLQAQQSSPNGQDDIALPTIIPPAPTVANLMHFEEVPVDHYTGQPSISIPLGNVAMLGGMSYPIGIHYNTQGIRVDERSGWLGTGFSMATGGVISRTVRGIPDELNLTDSGIGIFHSGYESYATFTPEQKAEFLWKTANGNTPYDADHDLYQYNFLGRSGRFIIKKQNNQLVPVIIGSETNDKITLNYSTTTYEITSFQVTDSNGYIYVFEESNTNVIVTNTTSTSQYGNSSNTSTSFTNANNVPNAWYLKEVKQPNGTILCSFTYHSVEENYNTPSSNTYNSLVNQNINFGDPAVANINRGMLLPRVVSSSQMVQSTQKYVKDVVFYDDTKVEYIIDLAGHPEYGTTTSSANIKSGTKLKTIVITAPNGDEHKRINFLYQTTSNNRLFLTQIDEVFGAETLTYVLDYNNKNELAGFGSDLKDHYGYFNNGPNPNSYITSKRAVNPDKVTTGALTSITYPTGGKKEFIFESNTFSFHGTAPIDPKTIAENIIGQVRQASLTGSATISPSPEKVLLYIDRSQRININTVINSNGAGVNFPSHKIFLSKVEPISGSVNPPLVGTNNQLNYTPYNVANFQYVSSGYAREFDISQSTIEASITSGWYVIEMRTIAPYLSSAPNNLHITPTIRYSTFDLKTRIKKGGGIRIKEILFTDKGDQKNKVSYDYNDKGTFTGDIFTPGDGSPFDRPPGGSSTALSSGSFEVDYKSIRYSKSKVHPFVVGMLCTGNNQVNTRTTVTANYLVTRDINQVLTPITKGSYVGYKKVYVSQQGAGGELYTYISPRDIEILTDAHTNYPFLPLANNDYKRGMLEKREVFDESENILVKEEYDYVDISTVAHTSIVPYEAQNWDCPWDQFYSTHDLYKIGHVAQENSLSTCGGDVSEPDVSTCYGNNPDMTFATFEYIRGVKLPKEVKKTEYFYEGANVLETITTTKTLYNGKNRVKEQTTEFNEGATTTIYKEEIKYPYDYESLEYTTVEQAVINKMVTLNQIEVPVQNKQYKNGVLIYDTQRIFHEFYPNVIKLSEIKSAKANTQKQSRVKFHLYTNFGQPIELSKTDGTHISYVWGYDSMYPIAKLENASYTGLSSTQTTAIASAYTASNADVDTSTEESLETALSNLRTAFSEAMVTTLTYDPLVGATRTTDPRGYTSYFTYDGLHRLKHVKDADKNILSANEYFYRNANANSENYVRSTSYQQAFQDIASVNAWDQITSTNYIDGLGRAKRTVATGQGGHGEDIVTLFEYDAIGRQTKQFLPYAISTGGTLYPDQFTAQAAFYNTAKYENTLNPYSESDLENSPLARVFKQGAPGTDWAIVANSNSDHTIKMDYQTNTYNGIDTDQGYDNVKRYGVSYGAGGFTNVTLQENGHYREGELYKSIVKDENWQPNQPSPKEKDHTTEEFKDKLGRVVLKRSYESGIRHDTYYIYDDYGNLTHVLPPLINTLNGVASDELEKLGYQYKYDDRNRLIEKKIPAKGWEYIVYDKLDRPVLTQDINLRAENKWLFTKYDVFGRVIYTGIVINASDRAALQTTMNGVSLYETKTTAITSIGNTAVYYTNNNFPNDASVIVLTTNYYDDYTWGTENSLEADYSLATQTGITLSGTTISKPLNASYGWNAGFTTNKTIADDGYIQYTVTATDKKVMVGLSATNSAEDDHYNTIDYAIYTGYGSAQRVYLYADGSNETLAPTTYQVGDIFKVERAGNQILFKKNDEIFHAMTTSYTGELIGDASFLDPGVAISDVHIGYATYGQAFASNVKGLPTGSQSRVLGTNHWITSESYYDAKGRVIHATSRNRYLDTQDAVSNKLDFIGKVLESRATHKRSKDNPVVTVDRYQYDKNNRLLYQTKEINGGTKELIARNHYDELGQLEKKQVGGVLPSLSRYAHLTNINENGNIITKNTGTTYGWDSGINTNNSISADGYISFSPTNVTHYFMAGLTDDTSGATGYGHIDYALFLRWGNVDVYESGINKGLKESFVPGDIFKIERREHRIHYIKNGETFYISDIQDAGNTLIGDVSIYSLNGEVKDLVLVDLEKELQEVDYTYNVRGWLKGINQNEQADDLFSFSLNYNDINDPAKKLYNGNISSTQWKTKGQDSSLKSYVYDYDALNRITEAIDNTGNYNLNLVTYDKNGNIKTLNRSGHTNMQATSFGIMDDLTYDYNGNQLNFVKDNSSNDFGFKDGTNDDNDYTYDLNGNMTKDKNKGINTITYNHLNLPKQISFDNGSTITYIYDATGIKLEKKVSNSNNNNSQYTYYAGNYIYNKTDDQASVVLTFFNTEEGYVEKVTNWDNPNGYFQYVYQYTDHLGNIRLAYQDLDHDGVINPQTEIKEENHYYPFGLKHKGYNNNIGAGRDHNYGFGGKEENDELGLEWHNFGARNYNASLGRWFVSDLFAESYYQNTPYHYVSNNPINKVDFQGHFEISVKDQKKYKKLTSYLKNGIGEILNNPKIMNALAKYGGFSKEQVQKKIVKFGKGSIKINFDDDMLVGARGSYPGTKKQPITINTKLAEAIENATTEEERELAILSFLLTALEESTHYGEYTFLGRVPGSKSKPAKFIANDGFPTYTSDLGEAMQIDAFWNGSIDDFEEDNYNENDTTGSKRAKKLAKRKLEEDDLGGLTQGLRDYIKKLRKNNPDAKIFIVEDKDKNKN